MKRRHDGAGLPLRIEPVASRTWKALVCAIHGLAIAGLVLADLPLWAVLTGGAVFAVSLAWEIHHGIPLSRGYALKAVGIDARGRWFVDSGDGTRPARLLPSSRFWPQMLYLRFEAQGRRFRLFLPADAVGQGDYRRLQAFLRATGP